MNTHVALFRGINVSGKNTVKMVELKAAMEALGYKNIETYIQSGNVIFDGNPSENHSEILKKMIYDEFGHHIDVFVTNFQSLSNAFKKTPFSLDLMNQKRLYFTFLLADPREQDVERIISTNLSNDQIHYSDRVLYVLYDQGYSDSIYNNNYFEKKLNVRATTRNLKTVKKLMDISFR